MIRNSDREIYDLDERVLYNENGVLVINKPFDIPTSGRSLDDDDSVQYWLIRKYETMVWAVHQLDADTTGVNLFTTRKKLVGKLQKCLSSEQSTKTYLAIVHGEPEWETVSSREPIGYISERTLGVTAEGKEAHSTFSVLARSQGKSLIQAQIYTGRTHQIRIHLSHLGFPLVGEEWYRKSPCTEHVRQALHAWKLNLTEPFNIEVTAPLAADFHELMKRYELPLSTDEKQVGKGLT